MPTQLLTELTHSVFAREQRDVLDEDSWYSLERFAEQVYLRGYRDGHAYARTSTSNARFREHEREQRAHDEADAEQ